MAITNDVEIYFGSGAGQVLFDSPWTYPTFSWNRMRFQDATFEFAGPLTSPASLTLFGRNSNGTADTTNAITVYAVPGAYVSLSVKVDGVVTYYESKPWPAPNSSPVTDLHLGYLPDRGLSLYHHYETEDGGSADAFGPTGVDIFPAYDNVLPVLTGSFSDAHRFTFTELIPGSPPPVGTDPEAPDEPIDVKDFTMTPAYWKAFNPNNPELPDWYFFRMKGGLAHFEYHYFGEQTTRHPVRIPEKQGLMWEVTTPYDGPYFTIGVTNNSGDYASMAGGSGAAAEQVTTHFEIGGYDVVETQVAPGVGPLRFFRIYRYQNRLHASVSANGTTWKPAGISDPMVDPNSDQFVAYLGLEGVIDIHQVRGVVVTIAAANPDPSPPVWNPPESPDPFDPNVLQPEGDSGTATLLELVREFSRAVKRAIRITGPKSIEMVDPAVPLPAGFVAADSADMYSTAGRGVGADTEVLSLNKGKVSLSATCRMVTNDVRVIKSSWRIPDRLPVYGNTPTHVQRVSYTFTPTRFEASFDFRYASLPLVTKEE